MRYAGNETNDGRDYAVAYHKNEDMHKCRGGWEVIGYHIGEIDNEESAEAEQGMQDDLGDGGNGGCLADHARTRQAQGQGNEHKKYFCGKTFLQSIFHDPLKYEQKRSNACKNTASADNNCSDDVGCPRLFRRGNIVHEGVLSVRQTDAVMQYKSIIIYIVKKCKGYL